MGARGLAVRDAGARGGAARLEISCGLRSCLCAQLSTVVLMPKTADRPLVRARIELQRKRNAEAILEKLGISPSQAINMLYAQIELKRGLPFPVVVGESSDVLLPIEAVAETWDKLDDTDYSYLAAK